MRTSLPSARKDGVKWSRWEFADGVSPDQLSVTCITILEATESWARPGNKARSCWLPDTLALFPGSCAQELREKEYLVYTHTSYIAENGTVLCTHIFILHFRPCGDLFELQDDIYHSEVQDSLMS